jgi:DNA repair ATPase RecN
MPPSIPVNSLRNQCQKRKYIQKKKRKYNNKPNKIREWRKKVQARLPSYCKSHIAQAVCIHSTINIHALSQVARHIIRAHARTPACAERERGQAVVNVRAQRE